MATQVEDFPVTLRGRPEKYPWDEWLDGSVWELIADEDFDCPPGSMSSGIYAAALKRRGKATVRIDNTASPVRLYLQFHPPV